MDDLIKRRAGVKGTMTRIDTWFDTNNQIENNLFQYERRLEGLKSAYASYCDIQQQIENIDPDQDSDRSIIKDKFYSVSANLCAKMNDLSSVRQAPLQLPPVIVQQAPISSHVNKPRLNISQFSGSLVEWESFYQLFEALIEKDAQLSDVEN